MKVSGMRLGRYIAQPIKIASQPDTLVVGGTTYVYRMVVSTPTNQSTLTYTPISIPSWLTLTTSGTLSGMAPPDSGVFRIVLDVADAQGNRDRQDFNLYVMTAGSVRAVKILSVSDTVVIPKRSYRYAISAFSRDYRDSLRYVGVRLPSWLTLDQTGHLTGIAPGVIAEVPIAVSVLDGAGNSDTQAFTLHVQPIVVDSFGYTNSPLNNGWIITSGTGTAQTVYDPACNSRVLSVRSSSGLSFAMGRYDWWSASTFSTIVRANGSFVFYAKVIDTTGIAYTIDYIPDNGTSTRTGAEVFIHVGSQYGDGNWHALWRDVEADLGQFGIHVKVDHIVAFLTRGSIDLDDITVGLLSAATGIAITDNSRSTPMIYILEQNYPNPFNAQTTIGFALPKAGRVKLTIYNLLGQKIRNLLAGEIQQAGWYRAVWGGDDETGKPVSSGTYFYRIEISPLDGSGTYSSAHKMVMLK